MPRNDGLDISHHQGVVDWPRVPMFRLMTTKLTDGRSYPEKYLQVHRAYYLRFRSRGHRYRGTYHWLRGNSPAKEQADFYWRELQRIGGLQRGELVQLDWETTAGVEHPSVELVEEWIDRIEQAAGRSCVIVYSSDWVPNFRAWRDRNPTVPYWHANYNLGAGTQGGAAEVKRYDAAVWQWTSTAVVPGFADGVDANEIIKPEVLERLCGYNNQPATGGEDDDDMLSEADYERIRVIVREELDALAVFGTGGAPEYRDPPRPMAETVRRIYEGTGGAAVDLSGDDSS